MKEVSKKEFFEPIYSKHLDVHPRIVNDRHPYSAVWAFHRKPGQPVYGKTVDSIEGGTTKTAYFIQESGE